MNREIKFRGKRVDNGEWVYGSLIMRYGTTPEIYFPRPHASGTAWDSVAVIPETVGQYTGLLDKNGKEIYEGDVVEFFNGQPDVRTITEVRFSQGGFVVEVKEWFNMGYSDITTIGWAIDECDPVLIIGNVIDNPELIKA